jgi:hypothetical protein
MKPCRSCGYELPMWAYCCECMDSGFAPWYYRVAFWIHKFLGRDWKP